MPEDSDLSTEHQRSGDAKRPRDTLGRDRTDPAKGSPAKGAHRMGDQGGDKPRDERDRADDPGFATNGE